VNNFGTVFKLTPEGVETALYSFTGSTHDGGHPGAGVIQGSDGNLYGTTSSGGVNKVGTIFRLTPAGAITVLYSFDGIFEEPRTNLVQGSDGNLYGTTFGIGTQDSGSFFKLILNNH
jgi:uncharacterized repeat protein (TIGR03803 family)